MKKAGWGVVFGERKPQRSFQTLELNLYLTGGWLFDPRKGEHQSWILWQVFNYERLHRNAASASRSSSVGSIIVSFDHEPCRKDLSPKHDCSICKEKIKRKNVGIIARSFWYAMSAQRLFNESKIEGKGEESNHETTRKSTK
jgi:hypothetical protein